MSRVFNFCVNSYNRTKKSFTLFEVLVALIILGIVLSAILKLFNSNDNIETYYELQTKENQYFESGMVEQSEKIKLQIKN